MKRKWKPCSLVLTAFVAVAASGLSAERTADDARGDVLLQRPEHRGGDPRRLLQTSQTHSSLEVRVPTLRLRQDRARQAAPVGPVAPVRPEAQGGPVAPVDPAAPVDPVVRARREALGGPGGPGGPGGVGGVGGPSGVDTPHRP